MKATRLIRIHGKPLGEGRLPAIITPLVGKTRSEILGELALIVPQGPDLLEWRVDFFEAIGDIPSVIEMARTIRNAANGIPLLLTRRSAREGGEKLAISEAEGVAMYRAACETRCVDMIDCELSCPKTDIETLRTVSRDAGIGMLMSFHDFQKTPDAATLDAKFIAARDWGADVAKVAVMPADARDVLELLAATARAREALDIPIISMAMGGTGSFSRMVGWIYGSAASFAVGKRPSAPGQIALEELRVALSIVRRGVMEEASASFQNPAERLS